MSDFSQREVSRLLSAVDSWNRPTILRYLMSLPGVDSIIANMVALPETPVDCFMRVVRLDAAPADHYTGVPVYRKIDAIKACRTAAGFGLKEAKDFVEGNAFSQNRNLVNLDLTIYGYRIERVVSL